jgi:hypothetical protein
MFTPDAADFIWVVPNMCHVMHECPVAAGDTWLKAFLPPVRDADDPNGFWSKIAFAVMKRPILVSAAVATLLVVRADRTARRRVEQHAATFGSAFPDRIARIRAWLRKPEAQRPLRGLWFLSSESQAIARQRVRVVRHHVELENDRSP